MKDFHQLAAGTEDFITTYALMNEAPTDAPLSHRTVALATMAYLMSSAAEIGAVGDLEELLTRIAAHKRALGVT